MSGDGSGDGGSSGGRGPPSLFCPRCGEDTALEQFMSKLLIQLVDL